MRHALRSFLVVGLVLWVYSTSWAIPTGYYDLGGGYWLTPTGGIIAAPVTGNSPSGAEVVVTYNGHTLTRAMSGSGGSAQFYFDGPAVDGMTAAACIAESTARDQQQGLTAIMQALTLALFGVGITAGAALL